MIAHTLNGLKFENRFTYMKSVPFTEKELRCKGSKFQIVVFKPGTNIKPHYHKETCEIFYILKGSGILRLNQQEFLCEKNSFFLCEPTDVHEFVNNGKNELIILIFKTNEKEGDICWIS